MKNQFYSASTILGCSFQLIICWLLASGLTLQAQQSIVPTPSPSGNKHIIVGAGGGFGLNVNGIDIGTILWQACDVDKDEKVTLDEVKVVAAACYRLWDTNSDGSLSGKELVTSITKLFPAPPDGKRVLRVRDGASGLPNGTGPARVMDGISPGSSGEFPTPPVQIVKHILAGADSNGDGSLSLQELNEYLKSFDQWDKDGNSSISTQEFNMAIAELARPD